LHISTFCFSGLAVAAFLLTGCSSGERPSSEGAAPAAAAPVRDACSLITAEEAGKILGSAVTPTARSSSASRSTCDYVPAGGAAATSFQSFTLEAVWSGADEALQTARSAAGTAANAAGGRKDDVASDVMALHRVDGLGDEAYFSRRTMSYVRKGDRLLVFQIAGLDEPAREHWEALARAALARLS
jgi:hypothetical protein